MIREAQTTSKQRHTQRPKDRTISARVAFPNFVLSIFKNISKEQSKPNTTNLGLPPADQWQRKNDI
jgi:hypothetical protein